MYLNSCGIVGGANRQKSKKGMVQMTVTDISREPQKPEVIRLAAYCRVSSKSADQLHSFAAQIRYYKDYERKNPQSQVLTSG